MTTILMIDDDTALLRLTALNLTKAGYRFVSAQHGIAGLQALENDQPSLVLLDISMPKLDGWETCRLIREVSDVPIIHPDGPWRWLSIDPCTGDPKHTFRNTGRVIQAFGYY